MAGIKRFQQVLINTPAWIILYHPDFLTDDPLFLGHTVLCKIWRCDKTQQRTQVFIDVIGTGEIIAGQIRRREGIGGRPQGGQRLKGVAFRHVKQFVFQKVGHSPGRLVPALAGAKTLVLSPVMRCKKGEGLGVARLWQNVDCKAVDQSLVITPFAQTGVLKLLHLPPPHPMLPRPTDSRRCPAAVPWPPQRPFPRSHPQPGR